MHSGMVEGNFTRDHWPKTIFEQDLEGFRECPLGSLLGTCCFSKVADFTTMWLKRLYEESTGLVSVVLHLRQ